VTVAQAIDKRKHQRGAREIRGGGDVVEAEIVVAEEGGVHGILVFGQVGEDGAEGGGEDGVLGGDDKAGGGEGDGEDEEGAVGGAGAGVGVDAGEGVGVGAEVAGGRRWRGGGGGGGG